MARVPDFFGRRAGGSAACLVLALAFWLSGCAATVTQGPVSGQPRHVFLLDHGRHTSLVLARADGRMVRYAYGDWRWYAEGTTGLMPGFAAIVLPSPAALGRRELPGPATQAQVLAQVRVGIAALHVLTAEAPAVDRLLDALEDIYWSEGGERRFNPDVDLEFAPHPLPYSLTHNSNRMVAQWLEALGFRVRGSVTFGGWRVAPE